ncbi:hypothetical protein [Flindersiella endophytica]
MSDIDIPYEGVREAEEALPRAELGPEAPEADAVDQLLSVDLDEDDYR